MAKAAATKTQDALADFDYAVYINVAKKGIGARKFTPEDVAQDPLLMAAAVLWLRGDGPEAVDHAGVRGFIMDLRGTLAKYNRLTAGQAKGALNVAAAQDARRNAPPKVEWDGVRVLDNGTYPLVLADGTEMTLRISNDFRDDAPVGSQMLKFEQATYNGKSKFVGFAFLQGTEVSIWGKYKGMAELKEAAELLIAGNA